MDFNAWDGLPQPRRTLAMVAIWLAMAMAVLDSSIANVALPTIAGDLHASPEASIWVINAYQIAIVMTLLPVAALGEIRGYRRVYGIGVVLFIAGSLACASAGSLSELAAARFAQGFGAATVMAINGALVRFTYPRAMLGRGIGYNALVVAIASAAGPSVAAAILAVGSWRWLFAVNVPLGLVSLAIGQRSLPAVPGTRTPFDWLAALTNALFFAAAFLAASSASHGRFGWTGAGELALAIIAGVLLVRRERHRERPLIPLDLLRVPILRLSYLTSIVSFAAAMIALVALPFLLQRGFGVDRVTTGLLITPWPLAVAVTAPVAGRLVERVPAALLGGIGLALMAAGLAGLALIPAGSSHALVVLAAATCGAGFGLFQSPNNRTMLGQAPPARSGAAAGMLATARLVGQTGGAVLVALIFRVAGTTGPLPFWLAAGLALAAAGVSVRRIAVEAPNARSRVLRPTLRRWTMAIFNKDMIELATKNRNFQKEAYYDENCQIVMMSIEPGEDIGLETHDADQCTFFVAGEGQVVIDGHRTKASPNHLVVIPKGAEHNIINKGEEPLKLFSVYTPPAEEQGVNHKTKADAEEAEEE